MSENMLRFFAGEAFAIPAPLEISFNECLRCDYCFSFNNGRAKYDLDAKGTCRHIVNVFRTGGNPNSLADILLLRKYPIVFSNAVDPLFAKNLQTTRDLLPVLKEMGVPVVFMTRGTDKPKDFPKYLGMLPAGSRLYCSLTTESEQARKDAERGCPSHEERCEMMAMAVASGIPVIAALNPIDQDLLGDLGRFFEVIDRVVGADNVAGTWIEPMHLSERQHKALIARHPKGLPVLLGQAVERATTKPWALDPYFFQDLFAAVDERGWRRFSFALPWINKGRADLFDVYPEPHFPTQHWLIAACKELSEANKGCPVVVSFETWCSWVDPLRTVLDLKISRGDAWYFINQKKNIEKQERQALPKTISVENCLRFLWNAPKTGAQAIYGGYGFHALTESIKDEAGEFVGVDYFWLREDDGSPLAVFAPQQFTDGQPLYTTDKNDIFRLVEEIDQTCEMLMPPDMDEPEEARENTARTQHNNPTKEIAMANGDAKSIAAMVATKAENREGREMAKKAGGGAMGGASAAFAGIGQAIAYQQKVGSYMSPAQRKQAGFLNAKGMRGTSAAKGGGRTIGTGIEGGRPREAVGRSQRLLNMAGRTAQSTMTPGQAKLAAGGLRAAAKRGQISGMKKPKPRKPPKAA